jgi:tetratricopeptide (TPR) repeat protein
MIKFIFLLSFVACTTTTSNRHSTPIRKDQEFKKVAPEKFQANKDYYSVSASGSPYTALNDESINRLAEEGKVNLSEADVMGEIISLCYRQKFSSGLELARKNTARFINIPTFWNQVATCYLLKGDERKAQLYYNKSIELSAYYTPSLNNYGIIYLKQNQDQKALAAFLKALERNKFAKTPRFNLANLLLSYGLAEEALPIFKGLVAQNPQDVEVLSGVANSLYLIGEEKSSLDYFEKIPAKFWKRPDIGINMARAYYQVGTKDKAKDVIDDVDRPKSRRYQEYYEESAKMIRGI